VTVTAVELSVMTTYTGKFYRRKMHKTTNTVYLNTNASSYWR